MTEAQTLYNQWLVEDQTSPYLRYFKHWLRNNYDKPIEEKQPSASRNCFLLSDDSLLVVLTFYDNKNFDPNKKVLCVEAFNTLADYMKARQTVLNSKAVTTSRMQ